MVSNKGNDRTWRIHPCPGVLFLFSFRGWVDLVVGAVFAILGGIFVYYGVRSNKIIRPYAKEEVEALRSQQN
ncbi:hypothetical protein JCM19037_1194 [Geomicrobium sp. JCM 19037]|uniref:hypothetical protein n=1 Tax=Geomicrobium sp. JCM 19037 TaxID=1460634 RepID=UPI00045F3517|nr:hypothetical protein [Geomicrobium sp. JCM 19037]GAK02924.1 hypothetical protein JCM19037_1194 [Geomicrobium sp. JCM 19037]